jgi:hypothetical protein
MTSVLPPIDTIEFIDLLVKAGYIRIAPPTPSGTQRGVRFSFTGPIARKGDVIIDVSDERGIIGVASPLSDLTIKSFEEILQLIRSNLKFDPESIASFYEFIGQCEVESPYSPVEKIGHISEKNSIIDEISKVIGRDTSLFTLRLVPKGEIPNQVEWFDVTIEPHLIHARSVYTISAVYRSKNKSLVQKFAEGFLTTIDKILEIIEKP